MNSNRFDRAAVRAVACACVTLNVLAWSATGAFSADNRSDGRRATAVAPAEKKIKSWHYQLQDINPSAIAKSPADMVVIDYSGENGAFTKAQVERMKRKPDGSRRVVIAYMSIGEAETYRWYWPQALRRVARPRESGVARKLWGALLASRLAGNHLRIH